MSDRISNQLSCVDTEGGGGGGGQGVQTSPPPEKSQMAIGFLRYFDTDRLEKQLDL